MLITIRNIALFWISLFCVLPAVSFAQVKPLASGDTITRTTLTARQFTNNPITFSPKESVELETLIEESGDRKFLESKASGKSVYYANNSAFTDIIWHDKRVSNAWQFVRFPPAAKLEPGMKWDVPRRTIKMDCRNAEADFKAVSERGPVVNIVIDGKETGMATIRIYYEAWLPHCTDRASIWRKTTEVLYSPELNELVSTKVVSYVKDTMFMENAGGWAITSIKTAGKKEPQ